MSTDETQRMTILMLSDDYRKAVTTFRLAILGTTREMEVSIFFTSCGLKAVKKNQKLKLPGLLRFFTWIVVKRMEMAGIEKLDALITCAQGMGVELYACRTCATMLRISDEKFIKGVKIVGISKCIDLIKESDIHLVIS